MARSEFIIRSSRFEGIDIYTKARVTGDDDVALLQADVSSYSLQVFDITADDSETPVYEFTATSATGVIFNTLQAGSDWKKDDTGYNFMHVIDSAAFTQQGGHHYRIEYELDTDEGPLPVVHIRECLKRSTT